MKKQSEVDDSLEFCKEIKYYEEKEHPQEFDNDDEYSELKEYLEWVDKTDEVMNHDYREYEAAMHKAERIVIPDVEPAVDKEEVSIDPVQSVKSEEAERLEDLEEVDLFEETPVEEAEDELEELSEEPEDKPVRKKALFKDLMQIAACVLVAFAIVFSVTTFLVTYTRVHGESMEDTLLDGDVILINRLSYRLHEPEQFDAIVFKHSSGVNLIKRIIAGPGQTVQIVNGTIFIDGEVVNENYGKQLMENSGQADLPISLGEDEYFVLGDNRNFSTDSRSTYVGLVKKKDIVGKVMFRIYPFSHIGSIE